jgi:LAO/AO transport system kinase
MSGDQTGNLIQRLKAQDFQALARLLTLIERSGPQILSSHPDLLQTTHQAFRLGITGPPGAGKSTLIGRLIKDLRVQGKTVGVIAVDPSSPFSRGAILGDRIRYSDHSGDAGVFIRSLGSRGSLGGLSASVYMMVRAFDLAGFDFVLIETVGVGQTELEIMHVADWVSVILVPESGDTIQAMKAGLLEIANLFIVNKSDRPGADIFLHELEATLALDPRPGYQALRILPTIATQGQGVPELIDILTRTKDEPTWRNKRSSTGRLQAEARALLRQQMERTIESMAQVVQSPADLAKLFQA